MGFSQYQDPDTLQSMLQEKLRSARDTTDPSAAASSPPFKFAAVSTTRPDRCLNVGQTISVSAVGSNPVLAAIVKKISEDGIRLALAQVTSPQSFSKGDRVQIKYWDYEEGFYFDSDVLSVGDFGGEDVTISRPQNGASVQRRKAQRFRHNIPISLTVINAADGSLVGRIEDAETKDLSTSGLKCETSLPLKLRDKLEISLLLTSSLRVNAVGWVVRVEPLECAEQSLQSLQSVAVEFLQLVAEDQNQLLLFLAKTCPREARADFW